MIDPDLIASLRQLCAYAQSAGAPDAWLVQTADRIVEVLLAQRTDPRHQKTLAVADQMANVRTTMLRQGHSHGAAVSALRQRYGLSRSRVYALLDLSCNNAGHNERPLREPKWSYPQ